MRANAPLVPSESDHSLVFWAEYVIRWRTRGGGIARDLAGAIRHHVHRRLFWDWKIDLRYRFVPVSEAQAWRVYNDALWLRETWNTLWR
jgi:hypothetical protein